MSACLIGLGSNLGDRRAALDGAVDRLAAEPELRLVARSGWYETSPVGGPPGQEPFLNGAALLHTSLAPQALLAVLERIETEMGRQRRLRWGPRRLDLDLLLYGELVQETPRLTVPHPRMAWRRFVLEPAAEVAPAMIHPPTGWTIARLLDHLDTAIPYVAVAGPIGVGKTRLAEQLAERISAGPIRERVIPDSLEAFYADPSGNAWRMELEFLDQRARLLSAELPRWSAPGRLWVSDFWFHQSLAFASVWLEPHKLDDFRRRWEDAHQTVVAPKLTVLIDAPTDQLLERIRDRGRPCERRLTGEWVERIRQAILAEAARPGLGPMLRASAGDPKGLLDEVLAAAEAMS
jgi:2-amino-4-hydroxy-6-hydroxymethyldihydropteridine diphosphokinase